MRRNLRWRIAQAIVLTVVLFLAPCFAASAAKFGLCQPSVWLLLVPGLAEAPGGLHISRQSSGPFLYTMQRPRGRARGKVRP